jgi:hypothetical protein
VTAGGSAPTPDSAPGPESAPAPASGTRGGVRGWALVRVLVYLTAAVAGAVLTAVQNARFSRQNNGFDVVEYVRAAFDGPAAASFGIDLLVTVLAGLLFMAVEGRRLRIRSTVPLMVSAFVLAFAFAFPAFLALRELRLARPRA